MKGKSLGSILGLFMVLLIISSASGDSRPRYPFMEPDLDTLLRWQQEYLDAPRANIDAGIERQLEQAAAMATASSIDFLSSVPYVPADRHQHSCGNCWVWAGTGIMEIAHYEQDNVFDRLSIQYLNSCRTEDCACGGGSLNDLASWYASQGRAIPWANTNARWVDWNGQCPSSVPCATVDDEPFYPVNSIVAQTIETHNGQSNAINNIKNILNQRRGVYFSFKTPHQAAKDHFQDFWDGVNGETEASLWGSPFCGDDWDQATSGGHSVVLVGYDDSDPDPDNHYWLALNSWGINAARPNGLFRIPMHVFYNCRYWEDDDTYIWGYWFETLAVDFDSSPPAADAGGPYEVECQGPVTVAQLDGTDTVDLDSPFYLQWSSDYVGSSFDDPTLVQPTITVDSDPGCSVPMFIHLRAFDDDGNEDIDGTSLRVRDTIFPALTCAPDVTVECDESTDPSNTGYATATDLCLPTPWITQGRDEELSVACPQARTFRRRWYAYDECHTDLCWQTIDVVDTTAPELTGVPGDETVECDAVPPQPLTVTANDNCDPGPTIHFVETRTDGACADSYTLARSWTPVDSCGNASSEQQIVNVVDTTPPELVGVPADQTVACDAVPPSPAVTATDNCDPDPAVSFSEVRTGGTCADNYTLTRTWTPVDSCSNSGSAEQTVTVVDNTAPVLRCNAPDTIYPSDVPLTFTATATDNCDADPTVEISSFDCFAFTKKGKRIDRTDNCIIELAGDSVTIVETGGADSFITWNVQAADDCGVVSDQVCQVEVVRPGR